MKVTRRKALLGAGVTATALAGGAAISLRKAEQESRPRLDLAPADRGSRPNILFVLTDQERGWDMLPPGFLATHCPARSWLLEHGTSVSNAHTPSQLCSMARGIVYSGQHSQNNGVWDNTPIPFADDLSRSIPTLGTLMQDAGYTTGYAGKWHMSKLFPRGIPLPPEKVKEEVRSYGFAHTEMSAERDGAHAGYREDDLTVAEARRFMDARHDEEQPWFLAVNFVNPHDIMYYTAGPEMTASRIMQFPDESTRPPDDPFYAQDLGYDVYGHWGPATRAAKPAAVHEYARAMENTLGYMPFDETGIARDFQNYYWNCIRDNDRRLGALLQHLRESGEMDRTVIVFTSDHGEYLGVHGLRGKGVSPYREASRVPFVVVHPELDGGRETPLLLSHVDIVPTLLGFAGANTTNLRSAVDKLAGLDLSHELLRGEIGPRADSGLLLHWTSLTFINHESAEAFKPALMSQGLKAAFYGFRAALSVDWQKRGQMRGMTDGRWKFARYFEPANHHLPASLQDLRRRNDVELYDLASDPSETTNLAADPAHEEALWDCARRCNELVQREVGRDDGRFLPFFARS